MQPHLPATSSWQCVPACWQMPEQKPPGRRWQPVEVPTAPRSKHLLSVVVAAAVTPTARNVTHTAPPIMVPLKLLPMRSSRYRRTSTNAASHFAKAWLLSQ